ncbi:ribosomal RNA large subunit methyltransferase E [Spirochaetota bacterium]|nr:ribosomal RNA large subunit methyltransferase E [Spirochaetota bacterium]
MKRKEFLTDPYARLAMRSGIVARSYYKLKELDERYQLITAGDKLLELGAHPGGWLQYLAHKTNGNLNVVALDQKPVKNITSYAFKNVQFIVRDILTLPQEHFHSTLGVKFSGVLSDLAPQTSGIRDRDAMLSYELVEKALLIAKNTLVTGGFFLGKSYFSEELHEIKATYCQLFKKFTIVKLKATRSRSREVYLLARGFIPNTSK